MKVILPVAGKGTRLRPHTHTRAKSLVQVAGKTVLEHIVSRLQSLDVDEFVFITDENGGQIQTVMQREFPQANCTYIQQTEKLGPAHAISLAAGRIVAGDDLLIVFNDTVFIADLDQLKGMTADCDGLIFSKEVEDYQRFGVNVLRDGYIVDMVEKPEQPISKLAQVGLYYLRDGSDFMGFLQQCINAKETVKGEYYLPPVFMRMIRTGKKLRAPEIDEWLDCGTPESLLSTNRYLLRGRSHNHGSVTDSVLIEPVHIAPGAIVRNCILGPYVSVASGSVVEQSIIADSIVNAGAKVFSVILSSSILGDFVSLNGSPRRMNIGDNSFIDIGG